MLKWVMKFKEVYDFRTNPLLATTPLKRREKHMMVPVTVTQELSDALRYLEDSVSKIPRKSSEGPTHHLLDMSLFFLSRLSTCILRFHPPNGPTALVL
jgi:hypothetical protein